MYKCISRISLFSFVVLYNYTILRLYLFPSFYKNYGYNAIIPAFIMFLVIVLFFIFLPKIFYEFNFYENFKKSKIRYIFKPILFFRAFLGIFYSTYLLMSMFFTSNFLVIYIGFIIVSLLISKDKPSDVVEIATLFGIVGLLLYTFVFLSFINIDFTLISFSFESNINVIILLISFIFDNFIYLLIDKSKVKSNKYTIIGAIIFSFLLFVFEYLALVLSCGDYIFRSDPFVGFILLSVQTVSRYLGNFKYIYAYLIIITGVFKFSFYLALLNNSRASIKNIFFRFFLFFILGIVMINFTKIDTGQIQFTSILLIISTIILVLWMLKEVYYVRFHKK